MSWPLCYLSPSPLRLHGKHRWQTFAQEPSNKRRCFPASRSYISTRLPRRLVPTQARETRLPDSASGSMARFAAVLLAAAALLAYAPLKGMCSARFMVMVTWSLMDGADSFVSKAEAEDADRSNSPFDYQNYERSSAPYGYDYKAPDKGAAGGGGARDDTPFGYDYKAPSKAAADGGGSRADTPFGYDYKAPGGHRHAGGDAPASATTTVFFHEEAVRVGERLAFRFPAASPAPLGLLPRHIADAIPFAAPSLPAVLALLGVAPGSAQAAAMARTLRACETPPLAGDPKFCATSLEALVKGAVAALGTRDVRAVTSTLPRAGAPLQPYTVRAVRRVGGAGFVACHDEAYPYTVYRCHGTGPARAYMVEMEGTRGGAVTVATVCHTDTSRWNPEHVSFKLLGTKPGGAPICHLMPYGHIIWANNEKRSPA
ncbi:protein RAFTIN 1B isoform X2 [Setaria viridis]|uniref:protein RAFTIN 1B isoform X2 n=1 Tax=Setaria viridis TaxID=4556 RepID=UPI0014939CF7|nr:BURP domain-containing protein 13-like isoform X2 [Setaria viridis]